MRFFNLVLAMIIAVAIAGAIGCEGGDPVSGCCDDTAPADCGDGVCTIEELLTGDCLVDCPMCGDNVCANSEVDYCPQDCGSCGDGECNGFEWGICIPDCHGCIDIYWDLVPCAEAFCGKELTECEVCGDGECGNVELLTGCPDCYELECGDGICDFWEYGTCFEEECDYICGDGFCSEIETIANSCPDDCNECGNGICEPNENSICFVDCLPL